MSGLCDKATRYGRVNRSLAGLSSCKCGFAGMGRRGRQWQGFDREAGLTDYCCGIHTTASYWEVLLAAICD